MLDYAPAVIDDTPDPFAVLCVGFGKRRCSNEPIEDSAYCDECGAAFHSSAVPALSVYEAADVNRLTRHVLRTLASLPRCVGAFSPDVPCDALVLEDGTFCEACQSVFAKIYAETMAVSTARRAA